MLNGDSTPVVLQADKRKGSPRTRKLPELSPPQNRQAPGTRQKSIHRNLPPLLDWQERSLENQMPDLPPLRYRLGLVELPVYAQVDSALTVLFFSLR